MDYNNTKYWCFTWDTNIDQKKLPGIDVLRRFLDRISETAVFQEEKGAIAYKIHYQGCLTLVGSRQSKKTLLELFKSTFKNVSGLTLSKVYDKDAILKYTTKSETRISGPYYCGTLNLQSEEYTNMKLRNWQRDLYELVLSIKNETHPNHKLFRDRYIIWVSDPKGGSGKSEFIKWLATGQNLIETRKLPIDSVDRLISAVCSVTQTKKVDLFIIDDTRTKGKDTTFDDMFEAIETIKNGHVVSCMYGKYTQSLFKRPIFIFFTNRDIRDFLTKLSMDRWYPMLIQNNEIISTNVSGVALSEIEFVKQYLKSKEIEVATNNSDEKEDLFLEE